MTEGHIGKLILFGKTSSLFVLGTMIAKRHSVSFLFYESLLLFKDQ